MDGPSSFNAAHGLVGAVADGTRPLTSYVQLDDSGYPQILWGGTWTYIGAYYTNNFDGGEATVICRQLGYRSGMVVRGSEGWMSSGLEFECGGMETGMLGCAFTRQGYGYTSQVACSSPTSE